jgi:hypothetical protein
MESLTIVSKYKLKKRYETKGNWFDYCCIKYKLTLNILGRFSLGKLLNAVYNCELSEFNIVISINDRFLSRFKFEIELGII